MAWPTIILCDFSDCPRTLRCSFIKPPLTREERLSNRGQDVAKVLWPSLNFPQKLAHISIFHPRTPCSRPGAPWPAAPATQQTIYNWTDGVRREGPLGLGRKGCGDGANHFLIYSPWPPHPETFAHSSYFSFRSAASPQFSCSFPFPCCFCGVATGSWRILTAADRESGGLAYASIEKFRGWQSECLAGNCQQFLKVHSAQSTDYGPIPRQWWLYQRDWRILIIHMANC